MAISTQYVTLDVTKDRLPSLVRLGQGDKSGTQLVATILDDGEPFSLTGYSVRFAMRLPNNYAYYSVNGTVSGNVATFTIDEAYAASVAGHTDVAYVEILQGSTVICSTSRMNVICLQSAYEGVDPSHLWDNGLNEAIERANAAAEAAEGIVLQDVPLMSTTIRGGAKLGSGLNVTNGVLSVDTTDVAALKGAVNTTIPGIKTRAGTSNNTVSFAWNNNFLEFYVDSTLVAKLKFGVTVNNSN